MNSPQMVPPEMIPPQTIPPGATIGMLGAGQLGRMTALAAARLGYKVHVFAPDATPDSPAGQVSLATTVGEWDDEAALAAFAAQVDVVTLEWENVPVAATDFLATLKPVRPGSAALRVAQSRAAEKTFANELGIATAPWRPVSSLDELVDALGAIGPDAILKTNRMGYDGKGQVRLTAGADLAAAWDVVAHGVGLVAPVAVAEGLVPFTQEISVIVARGVDGALAHYPPVVNHHVDGILDRTLAPGDIDDTVAARAVDIARRLITALDIVGLLAVEMFITPEGAVLVNEMAPRPHNSGHWTQDGAATCQFEQLVRAVCGLPLGPPHATRRVEMRNLIGDAVDDWATIIADPSRRLHLYGKVSARPGRKMGHVNTLVDS